MPDTLHGISRRQLSLVGWLIDGDTWTTGELPRWTARRLADFAGRELAESLAGGRVHITPADAAALLQALHALTDQQADEVAAAARDINDLDPTVPPP